MSYDTYWEANNALSKLLGIETDKVVSATVTLEPKAPPTAVITKILHKPSKWFGKPEMLSNDQVCEILGIVEMEATQATVEMKGGQYPKVTVSHPTEPDTVFYWGAE